MPNEPLVKLGPLSHVGIVVEDADRAAAWYERVFGLGPFSTEIYVLDESTGFRFRGKPAKARMKAAIAYTGKVFVELVEVLEGESPHTEFLKDHGEGIQHIAFSVEDIRQVVADLAAEGLEPILEYRFSTEQRGRRFQVEEVYLSSADHVSGTTIQLMEITRLDD